MTRKTMFYLLCLIIAGAAWGATQPLAKVAVSEGYRHFGLLFWQTAVGAMALGAVLMVLRRPLPMQSQHLRLYLLIAMIGSVIPGIASYNAAAHLPAGILSILLSSIPMLAFPIALMMGNDHFRWRRVVGLSLGLIGVVLLVQPSSALPPGAAFWIGIALISSLCYALEGNIVARWGTAGLDPVQVLCGASAVGALVTLPMALLAGQWINPAGWSRPDQALFASALLHAMAYTLYVWLVGQAGSVFAAQVSYLVTLFGVIWAILFLSESYSGNIWLAMAVMLMGLFFVTPRPRALLASEPAMGDTVPPRS